MLLSEGRKADYDSYKATDVIEFWGLVWDFEKRNKRKIDAHNRKSKLKGTDGDRTELSNQD